MQNRNWWKESIIYQVYPQSFQDSNGDGIGDLKGLISRLDYIKALGVDVIWLNPIYVSPLDDNGYDIADYYNIHPMYGTMDEFNTLLKEIHQKGLKLIMDLVVNHCSDEHHWFAQSKTSIDNPYRDYFFWKKGKNGAEPNNWQSFFGGSAWERDPATDEYFLHIFTKRQPDLNWENPKVREEVYSIMKFWLEKGIDGFRMDVISLISKQLDFSDSKIPKLEHMVTEHYANGPRIHEYLQEIYMEVLQHYDIMTVGEGPGITDQNVNEYVGHDRNELNMIFQLEHMFIDWGEEGKFDPVDIPLPKLKEYYTRWNRVFNQGGWITSFLDNHDFPRMVSRFGNDSSYRIESAKLLATLILTMPGTPCIYFGSEIGMTNVAFDTIEDYRDVETLNFFKIFMEKGVPEREFLKIVHKVGRDNVRTPMQWNDQVNAGFSEGVPWIKLNPNFKTINVEKDSGSEKSIIKYYQKLIHLRKNEPCLVYGNYLDMHPQHPDIFYFRRSLENTTIDIVLNFSSKSIDFSEFFSLKNSTQLVSNYGDTFHPNEVRAWEACIIQTSC